jgi:catalase
MAMLRSRTFVGATILLFLAPTAAVRAQSAPDAETVVNALEKVSGVHPGLRRNHAKGICATGSFKPDDAARALSISPLFSGQTIPLVARFSVAGPNPAASDAAKGPRGMALEYHLPDGSLHHMTMINVPVFGAASVQTFYDSLLAGLPDPATGKPDIAKLKAFVASHPDAQALAAWLGAHNPPPSYAETPYFSLHAFRLIAADKQAHWARWRMAPQDGEKYMSDEETAASPKDFLDRRLTERVAKGPIMWDMIVTLGEAGDAIDNPSIQWPPGRREIKFGTVTIAKAGPDAAGQCEDINFDPTLISAGFELSPDPILNFRSQAYAVSVGRRLSEKP